jgi:hypothetical protein
VVVEADGRLGRLYTYSKDTAFDALENFTTEALAIAIESDPRPVLEALCRQFPARASDLHLQTASDCRPRTQVALPGGGWLDLVLEILDEAHRVSGEVWIEVKVDAPESGLQLDYYQSCANKHVPTAWLLTLARSAVRTTIPNLTWSQLYQSARHGPIGLKDWIEHRNWRDLRTFLEEQNVTNDALGPISDRDAASLEPAHDLILKVTALCVAVHKKFPEVFPAPTATKLHWTNEGQLLNNIGAYFRTSGEMVAQSGPLFYGLVARDGTAHWKVAVDARNATRDRVELARSLAQKAGATFGEDWDRPQSGSVILIAQKRATTLGTHEASLEWFEGRLHELAASGVVETVLSITPAAT